MPRLFTAIEIPGELRQRLSMLRGNVKGARWVAPDNFHITLRFIGDVDSHTGHEFAQALSRVRAPSFQLRLDGLGSFGDRRPRAIWAGVEASQTLLALHRANERAARVAGLEPESRNFKAHVTLARMNGGHPNDVARFLENQGDFASHPFPVRRFVLYSSRANSGGGPYVVEEAYPLRGNDADAEEE